jgi:hypothetical protein
MAKLGTTLCPLVWPPSHPYWCLLMLHPVQNVDEDEILIRFALACRRNGQRLGLNGVKKPRSGSVKPRAR